MKKCGLGHPVFISGHTAEGVQKGRGDRGMEILHYKFIFFIYSTHLILDPAAQIEREINGSGRLCVCVCEFMSYSTVM